MGNNFFLFDSCRVVVQYGFYMIGHGSSSWSAVKLRKLESYFEVIINLLNKCHQFRQKAGAATSADSVFACVRACVCAILAKEMKFLTLVPKVDELLEKFSLEFIECEKEMYDV